MSKSRKVACPKCGRVLTLDARASSKKREVWTCFWAGCAGVVRITIQNKDDTIKKLVNVLKKIARINAMDYEYQKWATEVLAEWKATDEE